MSKEIYRSGAYSNVDKRRKEVASLYFLEDYTLEEIVDNSVYSSKTIRRDIAYIKEHKEEFFF